MKKIKNTALTFIILFITCIATVKAEPLIEEDNVVNEVVAETTKYYKTVTILNNSHVMAVANVGDISSITTEITREEYENANIDGINPHASTVITDYKKLTATMSKYNTYYYKYGAKLEWRNMPATRSYDIIAIGYYGSVKLAGGIDFEQSYCKTDGNCYTSNVGNWNNRGSNGYGAMFHLPSGSLTSLSQSVSILVEKTDPNSTLTKQLCSADYAHAQKTVSYEDAKSFYVNAGGIVLEDNIYNSYDSINAAQVSWTGNW